MGGVQKANWNGFLRYAHPQEAELSAAGRKAIIAGTKRWAALRKAR